MTPVLRASLALLLLAVSVYGQAGRLRVTASNSLDAVFIDGIQMTPLPNSDDWQKHDEVPMHQYARLIGIRASNTLGGGCSGIMCGSFDHVHAIVSDRSWKCSPAAIAGSGWQHLGYDDSNWQQASELLQNGGILTGCSWFVLPDLPTTAFWIWTNRFQDGDLDIVCRGYTAVCDAMPCQNGGTCNENSPNFCSCPVRWGGTFCELPINECDSNPCRNNGQCEPTEEGYECECQIGYTGTHCETDITACASSPCQNGGTCNFDIDGGYTCSCVPGYSGLDCETNIDECNPNPCLNGGSCVDGVNEATCQCPPGYTGTFCQNEINECLSSPCQNAGTCEDLVNDYECTCHPGWSGNQCEIGIGDCASNPCQNGGTCTLNGPGGAVECICTPGWSGPVCTSDVDECSSSPCLNGGHCVDGDGRYECFCDEAWQGTHCEFVTPNCGTIMVQPGFPPTNSFTILCQIDIINHEQWLTTPCNQLIRGINYYNDSDTITALGGTFGCYPTRYPDEINGACVPNYNQGATLDACLSCTHMGVCIKFPDSLKKSFPKKK